MKDQSKDSVLFFQKDIILLDGRCLYKGGKAYRVDKTMVSRWLKRGATEEVPYGVKAERFDNEIEAVIELAKKAPKEPKISPTSILPGEGDSLVDDSAPPSEDSLESEGEIEESLEVGEEVPNSRGPRGNKGNKGKGKGK